MEFTVKRKSLLNDMESRLAEGRRNAVFEPLPAAIVYLRPRIPSRFLEMKKSELKFIKERDPGDLDAR